MPRSKWNWCCNWPEADESPGRTLWLLNRPASPDVARSDGAGPDAANPFRPGRVTGTATAGFVYGRRLDGGADVNEAGPLASGAGLSNVRAACCLPLPRAGGERKSTR